MREDRLRVLEMLAGGEISVETADELLEALEAGRAAAGEPRAAAGTHLPAAAELGRPARRGVLTLQDIVEMSSHGVTPEFVRALRDMGFDRLTPSELIELCAHGVTPDYVAALQVLEQMPLSVEQIVQLRVHGVDPDFVLALAEAGFDDLTVDELIELHASGVSPELMREARDLIGGGV